MKKSLLLILSVMAFAGMSVAQDVYTSGYYYNGHNTMNAAVYKNGELLYYTGNDPTKSHSSSDVLFIDGNVFWVDNCYSIGYDYGDVFKNDSRYLSTPLGSGGYISRLFTDGNDLYAAGTVLVDDVQRPAIWRNDDSNPYIVFDTEGNPGYVFDALIVDGLILACGYETISGVDVGMVWNSIGESYSFGEDIILEAMAFYNGDVYCAATDFSTNHGVVYKNGYELCTLTTNGGAYYISIDAGDVYVTGTDYDDGTDRVWKNGEKLYDCYYAMNIEANSEGVFYVGYNENDRGQVWKDGASLYEIDGCEMLEGISIDLSCQDETSRSLPFYEGFETGATDWTCWHVRDDDQSNGVEASYWHRGGINQDVEPASGEHFAWHGYNSEFDQEGWLISPFIQLPSDCNITLTFKSFEKYVPDYYHEAVWVGNEDSEHEVWVQNDPVNEWKTVTIDLSDYQGQLVAIGFLYQGKDANCWCIDDVNITSNIGVGESEAESLAVYPNPARESIRIEGLDADSEVQIYNIVGELVKTACVGAGQEIGIGELSEGLYMVRCDNTTLRFVKE
ncbi:MAG: T9SS type A sorting domain-containing protein [Bacteroidales bacterium]|nr:T9SS type A sorting domain-containing protein [Bacteroidales bacterium]